MAVPVIQALRQENWRNLSLDGRVQALQNLENGLAAQEGRRPCRVVPMKSDAYDGVHKDGQISVNERLLGADEPYLATDTLFHEARHAYQEHVASERPDLAESPEQLEDFQKNGGLGYLGPKQYPVHYPLQPVEMDARKVASERMEELYGGQFGDRDGYLKYRDATQAEEEWYREAGREYLGDDYEQVARQKAFAQYEAGKAQEQQVSAVPAQTGVDRTSSAESEAETAKEIAEEEYGYSHGYGW